MSIVITMKKVEGCNQYVFVDCFENKLKTVHRQYNGNAAKQCFFLFIAKLTDVNTSDLLSALSFLTLLRQPKLTSESCQCHWDILKTEIKAERIFSDMNILANRRQLGYQYSRELHGHT